MNPDALADGPAIDGSESRALWEERLQGTVDESSVGCAGFGRQYNRWLYRLRAHVFRRTVKALGLEVDRCRVLDVGSGTGFYLDQWSRLGARHLEGLDFTEAAVGHLRSRFPDLRFHRADISEWAGDGGEGPFDIVSAFDVLFHIVDDAKYQAALDGIARLLRPGGTLLFSDNFAHHERPKSSPYHYSRTLTEIQRRVEAAGLELHSRRPMFVLMNAPDDSTSPLLRGWWRLLTAFAQRGERAGWLAGAALYPIDRALTYLLHEGPTTELAVCRRPPQPGGRAEAKARSGGGPPEEP
ncbi:class I SAM-dependent DNA methyltransferase [Rubrivirga sp. IMCC43871]|uniref:class I SAM-dependent DNA methyltransferase n=1 Tax=Rubrivirga sp. IMCC43871 TaxID=3391575 RepID=UPI00398F90E6